MTFVPLCDLLVEFLCEANDGLRKAIEASADQPLIFVAPEIDIQLKFTALGNGTLEIGPLNATMSNYYNTTGDSVLTFQLKLKPR